MPTTKATPVGKQRVRTGCGPCRKRRRKCDEHKPSCRNCEARGVICQYLVNVVFVPPSYQEKSSGASKSNNGKPQTYSEIKFVGEHAEVASTSPDSSKTVINDQTPSQHVGNHRLNAKLYHEFGSEPFVERSGGLTSASLDHRFDAGSYRAQTPSVQIPTICANGSGIHPYDISTSPSGTNVTSPYNNFVLNPANRQLWDGGYRETDLLCYFRYQVAPWMDIGDPSGYFGIKIMIAARESGSLLAPILTLATRHRSAICMQHDGEDPEKSLKTRAAESELMTPEFGESRAETALLMLGDFFPSSPEQWRTLLSNRMRSSQCLLSLINCEEEIDEALFWLYFRIDLGAAIWVTQPPLFPFLSYMTNDGFHGIGPRFVMQRHSPKHAFRHSLFLLASCLSMVFGHYETPSPRTENSPTATVSLIQTPSLMSRWTSLWNDCQRWYGDRPKQVQQVLEIRGVDVDLIDTQNDSSFPILVYTNPLAITSNVVYHITSFLLLTHRPRLLTAVAGPRYFTSQVWHAQSIAGIAISNDFPEQWDPILIASLLLVAKDMTHASQQSAVLMRLEQISVMTGMKLYREIAALKTAWSIAGCNERAVP